MSKLKESEIRQAREYMKKKPKQFGDLHERMRYAMELMLRHNDVIPSALWHAMYDLEIEVSYYTPVKPPYGRRTMKLG